jgi:hypothetical protein
MKTPSLFFVLSVLISLFSWQTQAQLWPPLVPPPIFAAVSAGPLGGNTTFQQLIDHKDPSLGTFAQRFWWNTTYWAGPGSPVGRLKSQSQRGIPRRLTNSCDKVLLITPGEVAADGYSGFLTNHSLMGLYAQEIGGAIILLERTSPSVPSVQLIEITKADLPSIRSVLGKIIALPSS